MGRRGRILDALGGDPSELFRRYFVNTVFDSTFVVLGILAASAFSPEPDPEFALGAILAACLAIGISTGVSVYEAEHTEGGIRLDRLERAMLSPMKDTQLERSLRTFRIATALVNLSAPLAVAAVTGTPVLLYELGILPDFVVAAYISSGLGILIVFATGYFLGSLTGRRAWRKAVRMTLIALLTFGVLVLLERSF